MAEDVIISVNVPINGNELCKGGGMEIQVQKWDDGQQVPGNKWLVTDHSVTLLTINLTAKG